MSKHEKVIVISNLNPFLKDINLSIQSNFKNLHHYNIKTTIIIISNPCQWFKSILTYLVIYLSICSNPIKSMAISVGASKKPRSILQKHFDLSI